eukprot:3181359-Rhodomonas_salina.1
MRELKAGETITVDTEAVLAWEGTVRPPPLPRLPSFLLPPPFPSLPSSIHPSIPPSFPHPSILLPPPSSLLPPPSSLIPSLHFLPPPPTCTLRMHLGSPVSPALWCHEEEEEDGTRGC